ncbi:phage minor head protein [Cupriavidus sp. D384]|uniref:phage head morphogenesis protein n=1 Tax=Cupriavidus sp. D384 TaxID=1538095 RepID=UPI001E4D6C7F|nr:phage minor head protein [Cupriavidus sp. D384]
MPRKPRRPRKWLFPNGIAREYARFVDACARRSAEAIERIVMPTLAGIRADAEDGPAAGAWHTALHEAVIAAVAAATVDAARLRRVIGIFGEQVRAFNGQQFHAVLRAAYGVDIFRAEPGLDALCRVWEAENLRLIQSIAPHYLELLEGRVVAAVQQGRTLRTVTREIRDTYGLPRKRAELIAQDQIGKLNGQLTRYRQQNVGIGQYRWRGAMDQRERDAHVEREGRTFDWDKPPGDGHPGHPIRCRCWAEPVLPSLDDLDALIVH